EGELLCVLLRCYRAFGLSVADSILELLPPVGRDLDRLIADWAGVRVHLRGDGGEEAAPGKDAPLDVCEESLRERAQARQARRRVVGRLDHLHGEDRARGLDGRELQVLLRTEVGEQAAL